LVEKLSRCGIEVILLKAPSDETAEDQLLVQLQGMIAEYERAQIAERSQRGKRHRAQQGPVNVPSGAPYGYRYVKKNENSAAFYEVVESEAKVVQIVSIYRVASSVYPAFMIPQVLYAKQKTADHQPRIGTLSPFIMDLVGISTF
jgi:site-specific DNA recombinase